MDDTEILLYKMKCPFRKCQMAFWHLVGFSDSPSDQTLHPCYDLNIKLNIYRFTLGLQRAFQWVRYSSREMFTLLVIWFRPFLGLAYTLICYTTVLKRAVISWLFIKNIPCYVFDFAVSGYIKPFAWQNAQYFLQISRFFVRNIVHSNILTSSNQLQRHFRPNYARNFYAYALTSWKVNIFKTTIRRK